MPNNVTEYYLTKDEIKEGIDHCFDKADLILNACEHLLKINHNPSLIVGLTTFALEEFGKGLHLRDRLKKPRKQYGVPISLFGLGNKSSHYTKISRALEELPENSKRFYPPYLIRILNDPKTKITKDNNGREIIKIHEDSLKDFAGLVLSADAIFAAKDDHENIGNDGLADFTARMLCFYVDWDNEKRKWKKGIPVSDKEVKLLINTFKKRLSYNRHNYQLRIQQNLKQNSSQEN